MNKSFSFLSKKRNDQTKINQNIYNQFSSKQFTQTFDLSISNDITNNIEFSLSDDLTRSNIFTKSDEFSKSKDFTMMTFYQ